MQTIVNLASVASKGSIVTVNQYYFTHNNLPILYSSSSSSSSIPQHDPQSQSPSAPSGLLTSGLCRASQVANLFPALSPEVVVREARLEDCWEVAETHCSTFFSVYRFPLDLVLRINRVIGMLFPFSIPNGCRRTCFVALVENSSEDEFLFCNQDFDGSWFGLRKEYVAGILTIDTVADFLPRKGPLRQRRKGIAYISNVAVREKFRKKGIAKKLVAKAEVQARSWGCRSIALHCDLNNQAATKLYKGQGFKSVQIPKGANWPHPIASPDVDFDFMFKLLR